MIARVPADQPGLRTACPVCAGATRRRFTKHGYWIRGCDVCHHRFTELMPAEDHVERIYDDDYFQGGGAGYLDYGDEAHLLRAHGRWYGRLLRRYTAPESVLDVGAAAGFVLQGFVDSGWRGRGLEPNANMAAYARTHLELEVDTGCLEQCRSRDRYRLVSMIQVVAHFMDLRRAFEVAAQITQPRGFWLIETWNRDSWTARFLGKHWHEYSPPSVLHWFAPGDLQRLAAEFGLYAVARGRPAKWLNGRHAKSLLRHKLGDSQLGRWSGEMLRLIPDRLPIPYPAEDLFWILFQKS